MKFYTFGEVEKPVILLLPGTCCHWKLNFGEVIPLLERQFHVVCVSYDGFDDAEDTVFTDMLTETEKIENYIKANFGGHIREAYGCSLGGSFEGLLAKRKNIHIDHAIPGSSDLDQDPVWKACNRGCQRYSRCCRYRELEKRHCYCVLRTGCSGRANQGPDRAPWLYCDRDCIIKIGTVHYSVPILYYWKYSLTSALSLYCLRTRTMMEPSSCFSWLTIW